MVPHHSLLPNREANFQYNFPLMSGRGTQVVSAMNSNTQTKSLWRLFGRTVQQNSWMWQIFVFSLAFVMYYSIYIPFKSIYQSNNAHRTYQAAITRERAHKKKLKDAEEASE